MMKLVNESQVAPKDQNINEIMLWKSALRQEGEFPKGTDDLASDFYLTDHNAHCLPLIRLRQVLRRVKAPRGGLGYSDTTGKTLAVSVD